MLSKTLGMIEGRPVGEHPLVTRLLKGCYNINPPRPKYNIMWDPDQVLNYFVSLGENRILSLAQLARKMVTLVALATLMRVSEIASIGYESVVFSESSAKFSIIAPRKAQHSEPLQSFSISMCPNKMLCPVLVVQDYVERTQKFRSATNSERLVIAVIAPHKPVTPNSVSRWIKTSLRCAGVDTDTFGAHYTRSAAASKATAGGLSVDAILRAGNWSRESTFNRFYNRAKGSSVDSVVFGQQIQN
ncbi:Uncharacterized protein APZ42_001827 [Daphnia magna]|uniref:Tyr recombinase domain-containing protein n=1 Tax=Daphnia magna TaxID=35525 RepID=A0A164IQ29_9CRUS|nr:Uncharacterized protein APZ42_001827 [Daphnia magna]